MAQAPGKVDSCVQHDQVSYDRVLAPLFNVWSETKHFLFPTHEVMGKMKPTDAYVAELIGTLRKAFEIARDITQEEAVRQK